LRLLLGAAIRDDSPVAASGAWPPVTVSCQKEPISLRRNRLHRLYHV